MLEKRSSCFYKCIVILSLFIGIVLNLINTPSVISMLSYYTLQSNIISLITFVLIIIVILLKKDYRNHEVYYAVKGGIVISILITAIVYQIALLPTNFQMSYHFENNYLANLLVHRISPFLVTLDYFLFDTKGNFKIFYPLIWLFIPLNYVLYVYTYNMIGGRFYNIGGSKDFAYIFLDYNQIGHVNVLFFILILALFILGISYLLVFIDKRLKK